MISNQKIAFRFKFDHIIDLITNSSSELFVLENKCAKETLVELVNEALKDITSISVDSIEDHFYNDGSKPYEAEWKINELLDLLPAHAKDEVKEKYLSTPKYYGIVFDRDWVYTIDRDRNFSIREALGKLGFEMVNGDY